MADYLEKFFGSIENRQTDQVLKVLNKKRQEGKIRTIEEFSSSLDKMMREITAVELTPTLKLFEALPDSRINSDTYNYMLDRIQDDLTAAFEEAVKVDEVQRSHRAIVRDIILKNLRSGLAELESKIDLYEFLAADQRGFDSAVFSTFRESKGGRTNRSNVTPDLLFKDPRLGDLIPASKDSSLDLVGERITLAGSSKTTHSIKEVRQLFDSESPQSELIVEPLRSKLSNLTDNTAGTYWMQSVLFSTRPTVANKTSVKTKLELNLGAVREVNFFEIDPASTSEIILESVYYVDTANQTLLLESPELSITGTISHSFRKIATKKLILVFRNEHPVPQQFEYSDGYSFQDQASRPTHEREAAPINNKLLSFLSSAKSKEILNFSDEETSTFTGYGFLTGFDNFRVGLSNYTDRSVYVSPMIELGESGQVGLKTLESRPYYNSVTGKNALSTDTYSDKDWVGSIEYWVIRQDLLEDGTVADTPVFPILPLGTSSIYGERILLTTKVSSSDTSNNIGELMFYTLYDSSDTNPTTKINSEIRVYRNGTEELQDETGNVTATDGWKAVTDTVDRLPGSGSRMKFRINIVNPLPGDIFTVNYTPFLSTTRGINATAYDSLAGLLVVDMTGDLTTRVGPEQVIYFDRDDRTGNQKTRFYLQVIFRQNIADTSLTPALEEFTLFGSTEDEEKFTEVE